MIICLCGPPGSGKTAIIDRLKPALPEWGFLCFDDYVYTGPAFRELCEGQFNWRDVLCPELETDLWKFVDSGHNVFIEDPRGKASLDIGPHIDLQISLNCPPHIAVARKTLVIAKNLETDSALGFLSCYLAGGHKSLEVYKEQILPAADLHLDTTESIDTNVSRILTVCDDAQR